MSAPVNANDVLFGSGIPAAKFSYPGDNFAGPITKLEAVQARKFDKKTNRPTDELEYWDNGDPKMVAVATLRTQHRDPQDPSDDGQRKLYIASRDMQTKVRDAVKAAGKRGLDIGGFLSVTFTHEAPSEAGPLAKFYEVTYQPAQAAAANQVLAGSPYQGVAQTVQQIQQPVQQPVQQHPYQQQPVQQHPYQQQVPQGGYYADVPPIGQLIGGPQPTATPVRVSDNTPQQAAAAAGPTDLSNLPPEAQALVQRMLAQQQQS